MTEKLIVNVTPYETRVAVMEDTHVREVFIERSRDRGVVGNIYLGRVQRVLPGMQAAFVEIGTQRAAFLYVGDVVPPHSPESSTKEKPVLNDSTDAMNADNPVAKAEASQDAKEANAKDSAPPKPEKSREKTTTSWRRKGGDKARIEELLKQGQQVLVQVTKDAISTKGPRVTCNISLPGRHLVYMPSHSHVGISRRITDDDERGRLRSFLETHKPEKGGLVARTVSMGASEEQLGADVEFLSSLWTDIEKRSKVLSAPSLVQAELDIVLRACRDLLTEDLEKVVIDDPKMFEKAKKFTELLAPQFADRILPFEKDDAIFDHYGVETELARAMSRRVWLRSGGYIVIDQAEALTAIDVNTGRFVGKSNLEDTIVKANLEAVREVAYQLRLRNIGGMVIIDFIDMELETHRQKVLDALEEALKSDRARSNVVKMSELGLVEMTRQRTRESLGRMITETCWYCEGRGFLKSKATLVYEIFRAIEREGPKLSEPVIVVQTHPEVADEIFSLEAKTLKSIEKRVNKEVVIRPRGSFHQEQFDIFGTSVEASRAKG